MKGFLRKLRKKIDLRLHTFSFRKCAHSMTGALQHRRTGKAIICDEQFAAIAGDGFSVSAQRQAHIALETIRCLEAGDIANKLDDAWRSFYHSMPQRAEQLIAVARAAKLWRSFAARGDADRIGNGLTAFPAQIESALAAWPNACDACVSMQLDTALLDHQSQNIEHRRCLQAFRIIARTCVHRPGETKRLEKCQRICLVKPRQCVMHKMRVASVIIAVAKTAVRKIATAIAGSEQLAPKPALAFVEHNMNALAAGFDRCRHPSRAASDNGQCFFLTHRRLLVQLDTEGIQNARKVLVAVEIDDEMAAFAAGVHLHLCL